MARLRNAMPSAVEYHALRGSFGRVSYFITKAGLRDVAENLQLAPPSTLSFRERIQRVIDMRRVETEILPYLKKNDLRFFNALVCIFLPDDDATGGFWTFEEYLDDKGVPIGDLGRLRITKNVGRVVLDGQHRFEALKKLWAEIRDDPSAEDGQIEVALIFVVVDELGVVTAKERQLRTKTISAARNLFAVLNKTARSVDKTTLLLIDDTDIANLMTRQLIEDKRVEEDLVKWTKASNLAPSDPYFTVIHVLKDIIEHFLLDHRDALDKDYGDEDERQTAMRSLYEMTPRVGVCTRDAVSYVLNESAPFKQWCANLKRLKIKLSPQPAETNLGKDDKKSLDRLRNEELAFTVAGQKAFFRAVIDCFRAQPHLDDGALREAVRRANALFERGLYKRTPRKNNPFVNVLTDPKGRMFFSESAINAARQLVGIALGSKSNREAVLEEYRESTGMDGAAVEQFWKATKRIRT